jgi:hypothetical protein
MSSHPKAKSFWMVAFIVHATRGILRDQITRRWTMFGTLFVALLLLISGSTLLRGTLIAHPASFLLFWVFVVWLTVTALLLAFLDLLIARARTRAAKKILESGFSDSHHSRGPKEDGNG